MDKLLENLVLELRKNGETYKNIVNMTGLTTYKVSEICRRNGLCKELRILTEEQINNCIELYKEFKSISKVAKITKISERKLKPILLPFKEEISSEFCVVCGLKLEGSQTMFCSIKCKREHYKNRNKGTSYDTVYSQKKDYHGLYLKYKLILTRGGKCECCGYNKNISALEFHHIDPSTKKFTLDSRTLERKSDEEIIEEFNKCKLLCSNCHLELHHPSLTLDRYEEIKKLGSGIKYKKPHDLECLGR